MYMYMKSYLQTVGRGRWYPDTRGLRSGRRLITPGVVRGTLAPACEPLVSSDFLIHGRARARIDQALHPSSPCQARVVASTWTTSTKMSSSMGTGYKPGLGPENSQLLLHTF